MKYHALTARIIEQRRDLSTLWADWIASEDRRRHGYLGTMSWARRDGGQCLYRRVASSEHCLGPRSRETEATLRAFQFGRGRLEKRLLGLVSQMGTAAGALRHLGDGVLGLGQGSVLREIRIHGKALGALAIDDTALEAYAVLAGVSLERGRRPAAGSPRLELIVDEAQHEEMIAVLRNHVDRSFEAASHRDGHTVTSDTLVVNLRRPDGCLQWLANAPRIEVVVPDRRGFPVPVRCPDPRYWAAYRLWSAGPSAPDAVAGHTVLDLVQSSLPKFPIDDACLSRMPGPLASLLRATAFPGASWSLPV